MISFLCPTRGRPSELTRLLISLAETCRGEWDFVAYVDDDDLDSLKVLPKNSERVKFVVGPRIMLTDCWNKCLPLAAGDIYCQANDDMVARTPGFDLMVEGAFAQVPDKILLVYGDDQCIHHGRFGPHPFVHKKWVERQGYFIPPYFESDFGDLWNNEIARMLGRRKFLPFVIEHRHFCNSTAPMDQTYLDRLERHRVQNPDAVWEAKQPELLEKMRLILQGTAL